MRKSFIVIILIFLAGAPFLAAKALTGILTISTERILKKAEQGDFLSKELFKVVQDIANELKIPVSKVQKFTYMFGKRVMILEGDFKKINKSGLVKVQEPSVENLYKIDEVNFIYFKNSNEAIIGDLEAIRNFVKISNEDEIFKKLNGRVGQGNAVSVIFKPTHSKLKKFFNKLLDNKLIISDILTSIKGIAVPVIITESRYFIRIYFLFDKIRNARLFENTFFKKGLYSYLKKLAGNFTYLRENEVFVLGLELTVDDFKRVLKVLYELKL